MGKVYKSSSTNEEVVQTIEQWRTYLAKKCEVAPIVGRGGIVGSKFVPDNKLPPFETRTVMFSLVEGIAPELGGLGELVNAKRPHVYVEGVRDTGNVVLDRAVFFDELYAWSYSPTVRNPDRAVPFNLFGHVSNSSRFLLRVYSANDLDRDGGRFCESMDVADVIIFKDLDGSHRSMTVRGGWRTFKRPFAGSIHIDKRPYISPSTSSEMKIVYNGLVRAVSFLY